MVEEAMLAPKVTTSLLFPYPPPPPPPPFLLSSPLSLRLCVFIHICGRVSVSVANLLPPSLQSLAIMVADYIVIFQEDGLKGLALEIVGDGKKGARGRNTTNMAT